MSQSRVIYSNPAHHFASNAAEIKITRSSSGATITLPGDPHDMVDVFASARLRTNAQRQVLADWVWLGRSKYDEKTLLLTNLWPDAQFFTIGTLMDTDYDQLPDTFELFVTHTDPTKRDTDGDEVWDGDEAGPRGLPWRLEQDADNDVVAFADRPTAAEGGACGRISIRLPSPAPAGGQLVEYRFGGNGQNGTEWTSRPSGNALRIPAGAQVGYVEVCAVNNREYADLDLHVELLLTNASGATFDNSPAQIHLVDNDAPDVRVFAFPPRLGKPSITEGTNTGGFFFIRDGDSLDAATASFSIGGTARVDIDYERLPNQITFPANVRTNLLRVIPKFTRDVNDRTIVLTITKTPKYQVDPQSGSATMTLELLR